jgi:hypothetical protein
VNLVGKLFSIILELEYGDRGKEEIFMRQDDVICYITLTHAYHKEDGVWVGICKETGTATSAKSRRQVEKELKEMVTLHLNCLEQVDEKVRFFEENHIKIHEMKPKKETTKSPNPDDEFIQTKIYQLPGWADDCMVLDAAIP